MEKVLVKLKEVYPLSGAALGKLIAKLQALSLPKGYILVREGTVANKLYFMEKGIARSFCYKDGKEITFWFGAEGSFISSYNGYIANKPGYGTIELLEDCILFSIDQASMQALFQTDLELANWGRKLAELELIKTEQLLISQLFKTAHEKYQDLLAENPGLLQRVQLGHIASYLGVTQVTLSRIRTKMK
ncbi:cyclic nucleotide-binding protein [Adhaeribacter aerolatus]|uniref:Cyclic nucleotide-binding protein n=1 Tax=Adhaeribacter aerolatus TaxID=670289 RepID=A0A512ASH2_9BACT|nr:Crp/Fnr family transcriptional regulator [Adhaeribacter aerolatus]GEO02662.1 cyclic nucleotide-binding protein [Adhaeribacter aerolatus]